MSPLLLLSIVLGYFALLILISFFTSKNADQASFFNANKNASWLLVAYGMIGASLSGVTFMSVPGTVLTKSFSYMQMVFGYLFGYLFIARVLLPIYYKNNVVSIYQYLENRLGRYSYKTSAVFFLLSRIIGASFRLFLVAIVFQSAIVEPLGLNLNFAVTVFITIALIWLYTFKSGIKTIIYTDTLQTTFMLLAVVITLYTLAESMHGSFSAALNEAFKSDYTQIFFTASINDPKHFIKMFLSGMFIAIVMTGLDQDMMQKNLTCRTLKDAQKNMVSLGLVLIPINFLFLLLGAFLFMYADANGLDVPEKTDLLFSSVVFSGGMPTLLGVFFIVGLIAAAYSSADSALTSLTTSFCYDILGITSDHPKIKQTKLWVHILLSFILFLVIVAFKQINDDNVITQLFKIAGYTYGPILGLFGFAIFTKRNIYDNIVPIIAIIAPVLCYVINTHSEMLLGGYTFGFELLLLNGLITFLMLMVFSPKHLNNQDLKE